MKNTLIIASIFLLAISCTSNIDTSLLQGEWKVSDIKLNAPDLSPAVIAGGKEEALSTSYMIDGKDVTITSNYVQHGEKGTWIYTDSTNILRIEYPEGNLLDFEQYEIKKLSKTEMIWYQEMPSIGDLTMTLHKEQ